MVLFVLSRVAKQSFDRTGIAVLPFLAPLPAVLVLTSAILALTLYLSTLWYL